MSKILKHNISIRSLNQFINNFGNDIMYMLDEIISNSHDADASNVQFHFHGNNLLAHDDGIGMNMDQIKKYYLHVGYDVKEAANLKNGVTLLNRKTIGFKGLGNLTMLKFSPRMVMFTKTKSDTDINIIEITKSNEVVVVERKFDDISISDDTKNSIIEALNQGGTVLLSYDIKKFFTNNAQYYVNKISNHFKFFRNSDGMKIFYKGKECNVDNYFTTDSIEEIIVINNGVLPNHLSQSNVHKVKKINTENPESYGYLAVKKHNMKHPSGIDEHITAYHNNSRINETISFKGMRNQVFGEIHMMDKSLNQYEIFPTINKYKMNEDGIVKKILNKTKKQIIRHLPNLNTSNQPSLQKEPDAITSKNIEILYNNMDWNKLSNNTKDQIMHFTNLNHKKYGNVSVFENIIRMTLQKICEKYAHIPEIKNINDNVTTIAKKNKIDQELKFMKMDIDEICFNFTKIPFTLIDNGNIINTKPDEIAKYKEYKNKIIHTNNTEKDQSILSVEKWIKDKTNDFIIFLKDAE